MSMYHNQPLLPQLGASGDNDSLEEVGSLSSFYSALQDGFRLSQCELVNRCPQSSYSTKILSTDVDDENEGSQLLSLSSFQVFWHSIAYNTKPKVSLSSSFFRLAQAFKTSLCPVSKLNYWTRSHRVSHPTKSYSNIETKTIIRDVCGSFKSGELTAIIGPSGAGKTSLLNLLARRREEGYTGQLYVQGSERRVKISSIPQNDYLPEYLTVRENLMYASCLKNDDPNCDHDESIKKVTSILGLNHCFDTKTRIISGGELKRLAIAQELLSKPDILILDEPTSGLDSLTCYKTISVLKNITLASAKGLIEPIAIVLSIHQPQQEVFEIFDKIYVLANGGIAIYNGALDKCIQFVEAHTGLQRPDEDYNPASFLIDIASGEYGPEPIAILEKQVKLDFSNEHEHLTGHKPLTGTTNRSRTVTFKKDDGIVHDDNIKSGVKPLNSKINQAMFAQRPSLYIDRRIAKGSSINTGRFWRKTAILSERYWLCIMRDPKQLTARIAFHILLPIFVGIVIGTEPGASNACPKFYAQYALKDLMGRDEVISRRMLDEVLFEIENIATLFIIDYAIVSINVALTTLSFTMDMQRALKEHHNGWYSMPAYIIARFITDIPMTLILPSVSVALAYPLTGQAIGPGLSAGYRILIMAMGVALSTLVSQIVGMILGALYIGHVITALFMSQAALLPPQFLSGFMKRTKNMSPIIYTLSYLSVYRHSVELFAIARYGFNACDCVPSAISGEEVRIVGISDGLKSFFQRWMMSMAENNDDDDERNALLSGNLIPNNSSLQRNSSAAAAGANLDDIFQLFAKQISLYNAHGIDVRSCSDVKPYQLMEMSVDDNDLAGCFVPLTVLLVSALLLLLLTVKLVVHFRTSL